jgi:tetratricopeptide (TPR) repeat protein
MPERTGVVLLVLGTFPILAVLGAVTLVRPPEIDRAAPILPREGLPSSDREEVLLARIAELEARLEETSGGRPFREEGPRRPETVEELVDRAMRVPNSRENAPARLRLWREVLARSSHPDDRARAYYGIAVTQSVLGRKADAVVSFRAALRTGAEHPTRTLSAYPLACELYARGDVREALAAIDEFLRGPPVNRHWTAAAGFLEAKWLAELGETDRAVTALRDFLARNQASVDRWNRASVRAARALLAALEDR